MAVPPSKVRYFLLLSRQCSDNYLFTIKLSMCRKILYDMSSQTLVNFRIVFKNGKKKMRYRAPFKWSTDNDVTVIFHHFLSRPFLIKRVLTSKKPFWRKLIGAANNLGLGHFGGPLTAIFDFVGGERVPLAPLGWCF